MNRIGYWLSDKKLKRHNFKEFVEICRLAGLELVKIDLSQSLEKQGPFDVILHKVTDMIAKAEQGNIPAKEQIASLQDYLGRHPETVVLDPVENIYTLLDRHVQYSSVQNCARNIPNCAFGIPTFVEFNSKDVKENKRLMVQSGVQYPFVCKPSIANGTHFCHKMQVVFNEEGLRDVEPPCVAQTFINHNAVLYKIFIIDQEFFVVERPSLKNFSAGPFKTIYFDSHDVSKADSASYLNEVDDVPHPIICPERNRLKGLVESIRRHFDLTLFGVDIIVENHTGKYYIIDINNFPSYDGVPGFYPMLLELLQKTLASRKPADNLLLNDHNENVQTVTPTNTRTHSSCNGITMSSPVLSANNSVGFQHIMPSTYCEEKSLAKHNTSSELDCKHKHQDQSSTITALFGLQNHRAYHQNGFTPLSKLEISSDQKEDGNKCGKRLSKEELVLNTLNELNTPSCDLTEVIVPKVELDNVLSET